MSGFDVLIPVKPLSQAKQRLQGVMSAEARAALMADMLARVLNAVTGSPRVRRVYVVTSDPQAARIGLDTRALAYDVDVVTANGAARAAPTWLERIAVGPIQLRNVRALVARPGAMSESLLGMSFLENLQSYTVERGRLILRAK